MMKAVEFAAMKAGKPPARPVKGAAMMVATLKEAMAGRTPSAAAPKRVAATSAATNIKNKKRKEKEKEGA